MEFTRAFSDATEAIKGLSFLLSFDSMSSSSPFSFSYFPITLSPIARTRSLPAATHAHLSSSLLYFDEQIFKIFKGKWLVIHTDEESIER
jgi:hypothetical protein